jgi:hypothetical protein
MLIKRVVIKNNIKFTRIDMRICGSVCDKCKHDGELGFCKICRDVFITTGVNKYAIPYAYYIPKEEK